MQGGLDGRSRNMRMTFVALTMVALWVPVMAQAQWKTPWYYEGKSGTEHWASLDPDYATCGNGKAQSPIDIRATQKAELPPLRFIDKSAPLKYLVNNGRTIRVDYHAPGSGDWLIVGDLRYQLTQFHFHRPSEEYVQGRPYDMALHLMYETSDGKVAGVTVFLKSGRANATLQKLWDHMPQVAGNAQEIPGIEINPAGLLPQDTAYYTYTGSLSAPPCTEDVTWYVLKTPMEISAEQIEAFARLYPHDVRPLQPLNGRVVKESE